jgi:hypothetical protein
MDSSREVALSVNGEIYNYIELAEEVCRLGNFKPMKILLQLARLQVVVTKIFSQI